MKAAIVVAMALFGSVAGAQGSATRSKSPQEPQVTAEQRSQMASVHEKMAQCLRSSRTIEDCRQEMTQSCHQLMGPNGCPMMSGKGLGPMHGRGP